MIPATLLLPLAMVTAPQEQRPLKAILAEISRKAEVHAVAVRVLESTPVTGPPIDGITKDNAEATLLALVKKLPVPGRLIRLNLPKTDRQWTAEEILAYARAEATLLKKNVGDIRAGFVEVLGAQVPEEKSKSIFETLSLKPVYVVVLAQASFGGTWETTYGTMTLTQKGTRVTGSYTTNNGQITGDVVGSELRFVWYEAGTGSGGRGTFVLGEDGMSFSGPWFTHENSETPSGTWTGRKTK